jgi:hypothetical protein
MQIIDVTPAAGLFAQGAGGALKAAYDRDQQKKEMELADARIARDKADAARSEKAMAIADEQFALQKQGVEQARADQTAITDSLMGQLRPQLGTRVAGLAPGQAGPPEAGAKLTPYEQSFRELERKYRGGEVSAGAAGEIASQLGKAAIQAEIEAKREEVGESILSSIANGKNTLSAHGLTSVDGDQDGKPDDLDALHTKLFERLAKGEDPDLIEMELEVIEGQIATEVTRKQRQMVYADQMRNDLGMALGAGPNAMDAVSHTLANAVINRIESGKYKFGEEGRAWRDFTNAKMGQIPYPDTSPFAGAYGPPEMVMQYTGGAGGRGRAMASPEDAQMERFKKGVDVLNAIIREPNPKDYVDETGAPDSARYLAAMEKHESDKIAFAQRLGIGDLFPAPKVEGGQGDQGEKDKPVGEPQAAQGKVAWKDVRGFASQNGILEEIAEAIVSGQNPDPSKSVVAVQKVDLDTLDEKARATIAEKVSEKRAKRLEVIERELGEQRKRDYEKNKGNMGVMGEDGAWDKPGEKPPKTSDVRDPFGREPLIPRGGRAQRAGGDAPVVGSAAWWRDQERQKSGGKP